MGYVKPLDSLHMISCYFLGLKRKKMSQASFDSDVAEGVVDIEKLSCCMETEVDKLRQEFRNCITTRVSAGSVVNIPPSSSGRINHHKYCFLSIQQSPPPLPSGKYPKK